MHHNVRWQQEEAKTSEVYSDFIATWKGSFKIYAAVISWRASGSYFKRVTDQPGGFLCAGEQAHREAHTPLQNISTFCHSNHPKLLTKTISDKHQARELDPELGLINDTFRLPVWTCCWKRAPWCLTHKLLYRPFYQLACKQTWILSLQSSKSTARTFMKAESKQPKKQASQGCKVHKRFSIWTNWMVKSPKKTPLL